jgi:hypothetical protein
MPPFQNWTIKQPIFNDSSAHVLQPRLNDHENFGKEIRINHNKENIPMHITWLYGSHLQEKVIVT